MKYCEHCKVKVNTNRMTCPLCRNVLINYNDPEISSKYIYQPYPVFQDEHPKRNFVLRLFLFLSIISLIIAFIVNYFEYKSGNKSLWSIIVIMAIITSWCFIKGIIISRGNLAKRIFLFTLSLGILLATIEYHNFLTKQTEIGWTLNYLTPILIIANLFSVTLATFIKPKKYKDFFGYLIFDTLIAFIPQILYATKVTTVAWPALASLVYGIATLLGMFLFASKLTKEELKKRFHL